jgi:hypothetical protein
MFLAGLLFLAWFVWYEEFHVRPKINSFMRKCVIEDGLSEKRCKELMRWGQK